MRHATLVLANVTVGKGCLQLGNALIGKLRPDSQRPKLLHDFSHPSMDLELLSRHPDGAPRPTPLLFVHGAWHGAWCWQEYFLPYFAEHGYSAHALSLRGHAGSASDKPLRQVRIRDYVADLAQTIDELPRQPILIGNRS